jgi:D-alanine-D-alanine ligase
VRTNLSQRLTIIYNQPISSRYDAAGEAMAERGVLDEVTAVHRALAELKCETRLVPLLPPVATALAAITAIEADCVFNLFEGFSGEPESEAFVAEALEKTGIPYTGCPPAALHLALDKAKAKEVLAAAGIPTPDSQLLTPVTLSRFHLAYPCIVKPPSEDASHGLSAESVVSDGAALARQVAKVTDTYGGQALVEEFLEEREFNATAIGNETVTVLPVSEIAYTLPEGLPHLLTFAAKWQPDDPYYRNTGVVCPADISPTLRDEIQDTVLRAYQLLGCRGYARVDLRLDNRHRPNVIEVNPNPDISPDAGAARQARATGMSYTDFIARIVSLALEGR